jgi:hypothetical protein
MTDIIAVVILKHRIPRRRIAFVILSAAKAPLSPAAQHLFAAKCQPPPYDESTEQFNRALNADG